MAKLIKREKKKRKVIKRFSNLFETHQIGFKYSHVGKLYVFQEKNYLLFTIRDGSEFNYVKKCSYGNSIRIPKWVIEGLKRRKLYAELNMVEQIRKYVKERENGCEELASRDSTKKVRKLCRRSKKIGGDSKLVSESKKQSKP